MAITITHHGSLADRYGDICIVDVDGNKIMIDGGIEADAELLNDEVRASAFLRFILSHWHRDHYGYLNNMARKKNRRKLFSVIAGMKAQMQLI